MQTADSWGKTLMLVKFDGRRKEQQWMRWLDGITDSMDLIFSELWETVRHREAWCAGLWVSKSWTWLSNWTTTKVCMDKFFLDPLVQHHTYPPTPNLLSRPPLQQHDMAIFPFLTHATLLSSTRCCSSDSGYFYSTHTHTQTLNFKDPLLLSFSIWLPSPSLQISDKQSF